MVAKDASELTTEANAVEPPRRSTHVPDQYYGYSLQTTRLLARLLTCAPGTAVSLEVFEDVGVELADGTKVAIQIKSTSGDNPVADRAVDLWKTFANWVEAAERGELNPESTKFEIFVSVPKSGNVVNSFHEATTIDQARQALEQSRQLLWGNPPLFPLKASVADGLRPYATRVLEADPELVSQIIRSFELTSGTGSSYDDLSELLARGFVPAELVDDTLKFALGWVKKETDQLIEKKRPAVLTFDQLHFEITAFVRAHDRRTVLRSSAGMPSNADIEADLGIKVYVAQLELIGCDEEKKIQAVTDFLRSSVDRTKWSALGWIVESSLDDFEQRLLRAWDNIRSKTDIALKDASEIQRGASLYSECCLFQVTMDGLQIPYYFVPGSFHLLADALTVGWHPNYKALLKQQP